MESNCSVQPCSRVTYITLPRTLRVASQPCRPNGGIIVMYGNEWPGSLVYWAGDDEQAEVTCGRTLAAVSFRWRGGEDPE